ncbi:MOSC domain-containing protein [Streptomyces sp. B1866]|uniref:MOSC domain-containing protein n=1 Tax=Streptomyces sp. B1866 TaxID=3075431 RepID=UPI002891A35B|nr:MOSC domain-containing protein [Streptomyces sp. B1866]MDT3397568.1 MOSC domain-containing protein [Streptomyces sp. B1866]
MQLLSVNTGRSRAVAYTANPAGTTGIDKRPVAEPVWVCAPGPMGTGGSGLAGDDVCDRRFHGGNDQAVYAYAREDLDRWERELGRELPAGVFGENLTTLGIDLNAALVGERWRVGSGPLLEVTSPRVPCRTFAGWLDERGWVKRFTETGLTGAYLRVVEPGAVQAGDPVEVVHRPGHEVTVGLVFRARTAEPALLPRVLAAGDALHPEDRERAAHYMARGAGGAGSAGTARNTGIAGKAENAAAEGPEGPADPA